MNRPGRDKIIRSRSRIILIGKRTTPFLNISPRLTKNRAISAELRDATRSAFHARRSREIFSTSSDCRRKSGERLAKRKIKLERHQWSSSAIGFGKGGSIATQKFSARQSRFTIRVTP